MNPSIVTADRRIANPVTRANDLFRRYKEEPDQPVRQADFKESKALKDIKLIWERYVTADPSSFNYDKTRFKSHCEEIFRNLKQVDYSAKDVEFFSILLADYIDHKDFYAKASYFLNLLITNCRDSDFTVCVRHLPKIDNLGYHNRKNITIEGEMLSRIGTLMRTGRITVNGNGCSDIGFLMTGGELIINGNVGIGCGKNMEGGTIVVNGDAGDFLGSNMSGGRIIVEGNTEGIVGFEMCGGEIHINGEHCGRILSPKSGKIYHKGKLI